MNRQEEADVLTRTINKQYGLVRKIGSGSFGIIYLGTESRTKTELAIKVERKFSRKPQLPFESQVYKRLNKPFMKSMKPPGFPNLRYFGTDNDYSYLVMDLVGPTLESLYNFCSRHFSLKTVLQIMDQLVTRVEHVHSLDLIHRDIKPDNLTIGLGRTSGQIMMIDFGLSKFYRDPKTKKHASFETDASFVGTARFCSRHTSKGETSSRRDDMESAAYTMIYFCTGTLPWINLKSASR
ncbi:unnamed protein product [Oikopleura dioica]|uniref:non-specific serine/threonine protein kinase n=1 Tax=Oikopleura dioica TaxID=34765 RepID=E4Y140_OIKDI|nr:unnamed protein product [Oikopleura dioica]